MDGQPKKCSRCFRERPIDIFPVTSSHGRPLRRSWCVDCLRAYYRERYKKAKLCAAQA